MPGVPCLLIAGLSPLARGTLVGIDTGGDLRRFIPAGAGNTLRGLIRGKVWSGLSPLARGTQHWNITEHAHYRFIPAGAGNTHEQSRRPAPLPVYPRWRGEHITRKIRLSINCGLSPLARGTPPPGVRRERSDRFIPAGAGNTRQISVRRPDLAVYPRWRGEHVAQAEARANIGGLSPLARGTRI
ncbi:Domain of uncharacterised function (DUF2825) [Salmonella enterica]|nr:Domain of uncharacterised function (DUF2825) [Salmonella enterica]